MGLINKSYLLTLNQRVQGSSPCAPTKQNQALFAFLRSHTQRLRTSLRQH
jgi:hypothetical protein